VTERPVSRRNFLAFGGGVASASLVWGVWNGKWWRRAPREEPYPVASCCTYVDYSGWILTKVDKDRLVAAGSLR